jgi:hypothetical protein
VRRTACAALTSQLTSVLHRRLGLSHEPPRSGSSNLKVRLTGCRLGRLALCAEHTDVRQRNRKTYRLAGIASTLAQYAADGWIRSPSIKQAKWGLELARLHDETLDD